MINLLKKQRGISLVEITISMFLGLLVVVALVQVLISNHRLNHLQDEMSILQENGRIAIELLTRDIRAADNWGCLNADRVIRHVPAGHPLFLDIDSGLDGENGEGGAADRLIARGARMIPDVRIGTQSGPTAPLPISGPGGTYVKEYVEDNKGLLLVTDCESADLFVPTAASEVSIVALTTGFSKAYQNHAFLYQPYQIEYFVEDNALFRRVNNENRDEIADQIEAFEILYGEDTDVFPDGVANIFRPRNELGDINRVVSVKINLMFHSGENTGTGNQRVFFNWEERYGDGTGNPSTDSDSLQYPIDEDDTRLRRVFSSTIALRNRT